MSKIIDVCTYNGEKEIWDIHYNVLKDYVDQFIVVEFDKTFSGKEKEPLFGRDVGTVPTNVGYNYMFEGHYGKYFGQAAESPNTQYGRGAEHWVREWAQKESIKDTLYDFDDDDVVMVGDVDEIWSPMAMSVGDSVKLKLNVYSYWLNLRSSEEFWGTLIAKCGDIKYGCLNHLRSDSFKLPGIHGCHFTSMGGPETLKKKLTDSYTDESYATKGVLENVDKAYGSADFLGRDFKYWIDESEWPIWLQENRHKFTHMLK